MFLNLHTKEQIKSNTNADIDQDLEEFLDDNIDDNDVPTSKTNSLEDILNDLVPKLGQKFLNEQDMIARYREPILKWFLNAAGVQLAIVNVLLLICLFGFRDQLDIILDFFKYFISFTFVEVLGGLLIIINFLFNNNLYNLFKGLYSKQKKKR